MALDHHPGDRVCLRTAVQALVHVYRRQRQERRQLWDRATLQCHGAHNQEASQLQLLAWRLGVYQSEGDEKLLWT